MDAVQTILSSVGKKLELIFSNIMAVRKEAKPPRDAQRSVHRCSQWWLQPGPLER